MTEFVSTATMRTDANKVVFINVRRERSRTETQARKAASRFWGGIAKQRDWSLVSVFCVSKATQGHEVSERGAGERGWTVYMAPEKPSPQVNACIKELGGEAVEQPPAETLNINGWLYRRDIFVGEI